MMCSTVVNHLLSATLDSLCVHSIICIFCYGVLCTGCMPELRPPFELCSACRIPNMLVSTKRQCVLSWACFLPRTARMRFRFLSPKPGTPVWLYVAVRAKAYRI
ncbi:unnamed protein product [Polarella glacialis]|uniref:Uncharacterized protein n=1 Tax=Polarella glacialis TaxID=89957 RepID=A0A813KB17_POLGL|nr:unnamed protein product [Polarella glacialis]